MAEIILGIGTSHSPMCSLSGAEWLEWGASDAKNPFLYASTGEHLTYEEARATADDDMEARLAPEVCDDGASRVERALDRLVEEINDARLDAVVIVGDDQDEHLLSGNLPPFLIYWGDTITNKAIDPEAALPPLAKRFMPSYLELASDCDHPVDADLAKHLIAEAFANDFDVATSDRLPVADKAMGHAFGFVVRRLGCAGIPLVPVMINTYNPPAVPHASRCAAFGSMLGSAIESFPENLRVGVIASGGLSHFLVLEDLDRDVLAAFERGDLDAVTSIPEATYVAGTSEIKNWIVTAAMCQEMPFEIVDYVPGYRTPAGSGTGLAFGVWR